MDFSKIVRFSAGDDRPLVDSPYARLISDELAQSELIEPATQKTFRFIPLEDKSMLDGTFINLEEPWVTPWMRQSAAAVYLLIFERSFWHIGSATCPRSSIFFLKLMPRQEIPPREVGRITMSRLRGELLGRALPMFDLMEPVHNTRCHASVTQLRAQPSRYPAPWKSRDDLSHPN